MVILVAVLEMTSIVAHCCCRRYSDLILFMSLVTCHLSGVFVFPGLSARPFSGIKSKNLLTPQSGFFEKGFFYSIVFSQQNRRCRLTSLTLLRCMCLLDKLLPILLHLRPAVLRDRHQVHHLQLLHQALRRHLTCHHLLNNIINLQHRLKLMRLYRLGHMDHRTHLK